MGNQPSDYSALRFITVDEAPANYTDESGELTGYVTEIVNQLQRQLESNLELEIMPEARAIRTLETTPNVIMFSLSRTSEREDKYHWLSHVITKRWIFFSRFDSSFKVTSISDVIDSKTVGVIRGDIRERWLQERKTRGLVSILNYDNAIEMLLRERIDFLFYESFGVYMMLKKLGYSNDLVRSQLVATESDVYIVMSKSEGSEAIANELQKQLETLKNSSWYEKHLDTWIKSLNKQQLADAWADDGVLKY